MIIEPPQPPQKQIRPSGMYGQRRRARAARSRCRTAAARRAPGRRRWPARSKIRSIVSGRQQAHAVDLAAVGDDRLDAGDRAGVAVPVGGADVGPAPARRCWRPPRRRSGPVNVLTIGLSGSSVARSNGSGGGGMTSAIRPQSASAGADLEVGAERPGDLLGEELLERLAGDAADDLADEVALVERVVARRGARLPPRRLGGQHRGGLLPVVEVLDGDRLVPARHARRCATSGGGPRRPPCRWRRTRASTARPARRRRARPRSTSTSAARLVIVLVVDQTLTMVSSAHGVGPVGVAPAAPHVDDRLAVDVDGDRGAEVVARVEVRARTRRAPP